MLYTRPVLACVFDVHGNLPALEAVLDDARRAGAERFVLGGDYAALGGWPAECVAVVRRLDAAVTIRGNWERWTADPPRDVRADAETIEVVHAVHRALGTTLVAELGALADRSYELAGALICHASPAGDTTGFDPYSSAHDEELLAGVREPLVIAGHTHVQVERTAGGVRLVNPGSVGMPLDGDRRAAYALLDADGAVSLRRVAYDVDAAVEGVLSAAAGAPWGDFAAERLINAAI